MENNNLHLDQKPTNNTEELKDKREFRIGLFLFTIISALFYSFSSIDVHPLLSLLFSFIIGWAISTTFFGIGFDDFPKLVFRVIEGLIGIWIIIVVLLGGLLLLYGILTGRNWI